MNTDEVVLKTMDLHRAKALKSLAGYKFWMFGYHAGQWVQLNRLLPVAQRQVNPFRALVLAARDLMKEVL